MASKEEPNNHVINTNTPDTPIPTQDQYITEKQQHALKKKTKKQLKSIGKQHPEFETAWDMMFGIRYTVSISEPSISITTTKTKSGYNTSSHSFKYNASSTMPSSDVDIDSDSDDERLRLESEFSETKKYKFPASGSDTTPVHHYSDFTFKDYCPQIFRQLREWFQISTKEYLVTICGDFKLLEFISNSKSGQFFFFSHNSQFIIKTMTRTESILLRKILPSYYTYVSQQPDTLLPKLYGMHRVQRNKQRIYFLIQQNIFYADVDDIHDQYDLKGSTKGRRATKAERKKGAILKDLDWIDEGKKLNIGRGRAKLFKDQLKRDTHWLRTQKIMDYSLLIGIHYLNRAKYDNYTFMDTDHRIVVDHSNNNNGNNEQHNVYEPPLRTVEEYKEEIYEEHVQNGIQTHNDNDIETGIIEEEEQHIVSTLKESVTSPTNDIQRKRRSSAPIIENVKNRNNNQSHVKSQSLHSSQMAKTLSLRDDTHFDAHRMGEYRGHVAVKYRWRYKRKTAAEIQFPLDDIDILDGIKHEVNEETQQIEQERKAQLQYVSVAKPECKEDIHMNMDLNDAHSSGDICPWTTFHGGMDSVDGNEVYFVGIIDILQKYNKSKQLENWFKSMKYDKKAISAVPPDVYAQRMCDFFEDKVV